MIKSGSIGWAFPVAWLLVSACSVVGLNLPFEGMAPTPDGTRLKPTLGWLTTSIDPDASLAPEGSTALETVRIGGKSVWQQVRRLNTSEGYFADSILLDRNTLRPIVTWRWTPKGTWVARYNHRVVERDFTPTGGSTQHSTETLELEPYSALGIELVLATLPMGEGEHGMLPVTVDTAERGWTWMRYTVMREIDLVERPGLKPVSSWVVDADISGERTRFWIAVDGKSVRRIEKLGPDAEVLSVIRRILLGGGLGRSQQGAP